MKRNKRLKYLRNEAIEEVTASRIYEYEREFDTKVEFPVPLQLIVENIIGLHFDWDQIEENPGEKILGGLIPSEKKIMMNEKHLDLFKEKPGLERSTIGHEAGHWDIDIDHSTIDHPSLLNFDVDKNTVHREAQSSKVMVKVLKRAIKDARYFKVYKELNKGLDAPEVKSAVDRYQSALLMPKWLIIEADKTYDFTEWSDLYALAEKAEVTISNLTVRLQRLGFIFIRENSKEIYKSEAQYNGQEELF